jgi:hypothetical protein
MLPTMAFLVPLRAAGPALLLAIVGAERTVVAAPVRHVALAWSQNDPTCIGAGELSSTVERTLGRPVFHSDAPTFAKVIGDVGRTGAGHFDAHLTLLDKDGKSLAERTLTTPGECGRLDESIAVVVTLMIDGVEDAPSPLQIPSAPPRRVAPDAPSPVDPRPPALTLRLGLGAGLSSSLLPGIVASIGVRGEVAPRSFVPIALAVRVLPSSTATYNGGGGQFSAWVGDVAACPAWSSRQVRLGGCAGFGGGMLDGNEVNLSDGENHLRPLVLATLVPFVAVRLTGPLWARLEAGAWFPLLRERWGYLDGRGAFVTVFRAAPVVPTAHARAASRIIKRQWSGHGEGERDDRRDPAQRRRASRSGASLP